VIVPLGAWSGGPSRVPSAASEGSADQGDRPRSASRRTSFDYLVVTLLMVVAFSPLSFLKLASFSYGFDTAIFSNVVWRLAHGYDSVSALTSFSHFSDRPSLLLLILVPLARIAGPWAAQILFAFQALSVAMVSWSVWRFACAKGLSPRLAAAVTWSHSLAQAAGLLPRANSISRIQCRSRHGVWGPRFFVLGRAYSLLMFSSMGGSVAGRVRVREITSDEGNRLLRIVRRSSGSVVTWRRAQMVLLSAQGMDVARIGEVAFTSLDRVRAVIHNFNDDGFDSLYPRYAGGRPPTFTLPQRHEIKKMALSRPVDHGLAFSTWSLSKLAEFLVAEGVVDDISHEGLRVLLREEGVSFQVIKTWKQSTDPDFEAKKNRVLELYDIADGKTEPGVDDPQVVICMDEFGPLNLLPRRGHQWAPVATKATKGTPGGPRRRRRRATYRRTLGVRHLFAAYDLGADKIYGHIKTNKRRVTFLAFCRYLRSLYPPEVRIAIVLDNFSPHLSTRVDTRVGDWAGANNVELAYVPTNASWLNRIEAQFQALRYFTLDGTDHRTHEEQNSMIRRYIRWRNTNAQDQTLQELVKRANVA